MPRETLLHGWGIGVGPADSSDHVIIQLQDPMTGDTIKVALDSDAAQTIGKGLLAPRVSQPPTQQIVLPR